MINQSMTRSLALCLFVMPSLGIAMDATRALLTTCSSATVNFLQENGPTIAKAVAIPAVTGVALFGLDCVPSDHKIQPFIPSIKVFISTIAMMSSLAFCRNQLANNPPFEAFKQTIPFVPLMVTPMISCKYGNKNWIWAIPATLVAAGVNCGYQARKMSNA